MLLLVVSPGLAQAIDVCLYIAGIAFYGINPVARSFWRKRSYTVGCSVDN
jgi:hypothetical protein